MFISKVITILFLFTLCVSSQATDLDQQQTESSHSYLSENKTESFFSGYSLTVGTALLSRDLPETKPELFPGNINVLIGNKDWSYQELYLNLQLLNKDPSGKNKIFMFEFIPRLFYAFSIVGVKPHAGLGLGVGIQPYHIYSENKDVGLSFSLLPQFFTGVKAPNIYNNFGFFIELNFTAFWFPFFDEDEKTVGTGIDEDKKDKDKKTTEAAEKEYSPYFGHTLLNFGVSYQF